MSTSKIKIVLSKIKYEDKNKEIINFVFNEKNIDVISKHIARGLLLANKDQDIIFKFIDKKEREISQTQGIIFDQKDSSIFQLNIQFQYPTNLRFIINLLIILLNTMNT